MSTSNFDFQPLTLQHDDGTNIIVPDDEFLSDKEIDSEVDVSGTMRESPRYVVGNCLDKLKYLPDCSVQCCITSPPYFNLRDYGTKDQIGQESTVEQYVNALLEVSREVKRVLRDDGTYFLNLGDKYDDKSISGAPWQVAFALIEDGWFLRNAIIWEKPNVNPESVTDRFSSSYETVFFFSKCKKYYFNQEAVLEPYKTNINKLSDAPISSKAVSRVAEVKSLSAQAAAKGRKAKDFFKRGGRNKRDVWRISTEKCKEAHFATFPQDLVKTCLLSATRKSDLVVDPFNGSGTTGIVCFKTGRRFIGFDLNPEYVNIAIRRFHEECFPDPWTNWSLVDAAYMENHCILADLSCYEDHAAWLMSDLELDKKEKAFAAKNESLALAPPVFENLKEEWVTPRQAAEILRVSIKTIYRWNALEILRGQKVGPRLVKFRQTEVLALLPSNERKANERS